MWGALRCTFFLRLTIYYVCTRVVLLCFMRINAFYVSVYVFFVFYAVFVFYVFAFYAVNAFYAVFACADRQNCDWHSYRFEQVAESYQIKEFDPHPMSPSLLWRKIVISGPIKKLKQTSVNV